MATMLFGVAAIIVAVAKLVGEWYRGRACLTLAQRLPQPESSRRMPGAMNTALPESSRHLPPPQDPEFK
jgi:hypothetical protein